MAIKSRNYKSLINVKLDFKKDAPPKEYSRIRDRLELPRETFSGFINSTSLSDYLKSEEGLEVDERVYDNFSRGRKVSVNSNRRKMTLEINVESEKTLDSDELLNVINLYNFILTGEYPSKGKK